MYVMKISEWIFVMACSAFFYEKKITAETG